MFSKLDSILERTNVEHHLLKYDSLEAINSRTFKSLDIEEVMTHYNEHPYIEAVDGTEGQSEVVQTFIERIQSRVKALQ